MFTSRVKLCVLFFVFLFLSHFHIDKSLANGSTPIINEYDLLYESRNRSIWGPGEAWSIPDTTIPIIDRFDWNESFDWDAQLSAEDYYIEDYPETPEGTIGVELSGETYGEFGLDVVFRDFGAASADIVYPVSIITNQSGPLQAGETITLETNWVSTDGTVFEVSPLQGIIDLDATYELYAELYAEACFFACADTHFGTPYHLEKTTDTILSVSIQDPISLDNIPGFDGHIRIPVIDHTVSKEADGRTLVAEGTDDNFVSVTADIDFWLTSWFGYVFEYCDDPLDIEICFELLGIDTNFMMSQYQRLTLSPELMISVQLPESVAYEIYNGTTLIDSGTSQSLTYNADYILAITVPTDWSSNELLEPIFELETAIENQTETKFAQDISLNAISVTEPFEIGPAFEYSIDIFSYTDDSLFDQNLAPWALPFNLQRRIYLPILQKE
ncbi:MAG: hypothetical protein AAF490_00040 [Chloroflexota bacterium]